jgi:hypothetical protein
MNSKIDLTRKGDFLGRRSSYTLGRFSLIPSYYNLSGKPWCEDEEAQYEFFVDGETRPWARVEWDDVAEVFCYRCGKRLDEELPWRRKEHDLCYDCRLALASHDKLDYVFHDEPIQGSYDKVFVEEYKD